MASQAGREVLKCKVEGSIVTFVPKSAQDKFICVSRTRKIHALRKHPDGTIRAMRSLYTTAVCPLPKWSRRQNLVEVPDIVRGICQV